jgi:hypothetical protein
MNEKMPALAAYRAGKLSLPPGYHLDVDAEEPTSGLEPLTSSHYECAVSGCWALHRIANPA